MRPEEAARVAVAFQVAVTMLGARVAASALSLFRRRAERGAPDGAWLDEATDLVMDARVAAYEMAVAFYRLHRALQTGYTVRAPGRAEGPSTTLGRLRAEFLESLPGNMPEHLAYRPARDGMDATVRIDPIDVFPRNVTAQRERAARVEARTALQALGPDGLTKRLDKIQARIDSERSQLTAQEADKLRADAREKSAARQAAAADRITKNGARHAVSAATSRDRRVLGYARLSRTGTPCGFCAMLISRDIPYTSEKSAWLDGDGEEYHDNCNCYVVPVYRMEQYRDDPAFEQQRYYRRLWNQHGNLSSFRAAVRADNARRSASSPARPGGGPSPTTAQEA